ncbi:MAG: phosphoribosylglycinamide synthetase [Piscirickettsiaceae bacterium]|nr:MAG: phosphoribosylglycinamide synthetase [Piscirickettsiaceae bacterium]PCH84910.1 MAG: phosphoribosylglycinamide synthetase [Piscirickettsiaceae bacterium]
MWIIEWWLWVLTLRLLSVLLIAPNNSYRIHAYIEAAKHLNVTLVVASQSEYSLVSAVADGIQIDFADEDTSLERIVKAHKQHHFQAVIASDDGSVGLVAKVAQALGLSANDSGSAELTRRKDLARARLATCGVPIPDFRVVDFAKDIPEQLQSLTYPVVVKPLSLSGSKGVIRANNQQECEQALTRIAPMLSHLSHPAEREHVLIESYMEGAEVAFEGILHQGLLKQLAIFDKPDVMEGPFFEETYYVTPSRLPTAHLECIKQRVTEACEAYGLREGSVHAELRWHNNDAYIIEIASRTIGGDCADMLKFGLNIGLEEMVLLQALGKPIELPAQKDSVGVLMIPIPSGGILRRVEGVSRAEQVEFITDVGISVREGYELVPLPEGSSYLGFIFAKAPTPQQVEAALRDAHKCLNIRIVPSFKLLEV